MPDFRRSVVLPFVLAASAAACGQRIQGSGHVVTDPRAVSDFTSVSLDGTGELSIEQTGTESLTISADDNLLPYLTSDVEGGRLLLRTKPGVNLRPSGKIVYRLTTKRLDGISIAGSGSVTAKGLATDALSVSLTGSADIKLAGKAGRQTVTMTGAGGFDGEDLATESTTVTITGSGSAIVAASKALDVNVTGAGSVEYIGDPAVTQHVIGAGSVRKR